jgi:hypothetical protein
VFTLDLSWGMAFSKYVFRRGKFLLTVASDSSAADSIQIEQFKEHIALEKRIGKMGKYSVKSLFKIKL